MSEDVPERLHTVKEAASILGLKYWQLKRAKKAKKAPSFGSFKTKLDRARLERVSGAVFSDRDIENLQEILTLYKHRLEDVPLWMAGHVEVVKIQQQQQQRLRPLVEFVWIVWRDAGGRGFGASWNKDPDVQGPFIRLIQELFKQADLEEPDGRTLRRHLQFFRSELEPATRKRNAASTT